MQQSNNQATNGTFKVTKKDWTFKPGYGPQKNGSQDSFCLFDVADADFNAIYDGYGPSGLQVSRIVNDYHQTHFERDYKKVKGLKDIEETREFIEEGFKIANQMLNSSELDISLSGTCCLSVIIQKNRCYVANIGNSRAVLCRTVENEKKAIDLSKDQTLQRLDEKERIIKSTGKLERAKYNDMPFGPERIWQNEKGPGLVITRALGSYDYEKIGLLSKPEIECFPLALGDDFIVLASDGLWEVMTSAEVVEFIAKQESKEKVADVLAEEAQTRWKELNKNKKDMVAAGDVEHTFGWENLATDPYEDTMDDITIVILYLGLSNE